MNKGKIELKARGVGDSKGNADVTLPIRSPNQSMKPIAPLTESKAVIGRAVPRYWSLATTCAIRRNPVRFCERKSLSQYAHFPLPRQPWRRLRIEPLNKVC